MRAHSFSPLPSSLFSSSGVSDVGAAVVRESSLEEQPLLPLSDPASRPPWGSQSGPTWNRTEHVSATVSATFNFEEHMGVYSI